MVTINEHPKYLSGNSATAEPEFVKIIEIPVSPHPEFSGIDTFVRLSEPDYIHQSDRSHCNEIPYQSMIFKTSFEFLRNDKSDIKR